ncbi:MAG: Oligopeptide-binding protein AppA precursor [Firmicutes bacterium ADurb.BinA052]|nr:MAG: Oligopeptide-binding protein AppA precursor [Firmicutes bacterium ADurb.BinA052]
MKNLRFGLAVLLFVAVIAGMSVMGQAAGQVYEIALGEEPTTLSIWASLGPDATVWNAYVGYQQSYIGLYGNAAPDFVFSPSAALGMPTPFKEEKIDGKTFYTSVVRMRRDVKWSDGKPVTADDVVFSYMAPLAFDPNKLGGNWPGMVDPEILARVEKVDDYSVKFFLIELPGLAQWQYGMLQAYILPKAYWGPIVDKALKAVDPVKELFAHDPLGTEPVAGAWAVERWEKGAFLTHKPNKYYGLKGDTTTFYKSGGFMMENKKSGVKWTTGDVKGDVKLQVVEGPYADELRFRVLQNQNATVLALIKGDVDVILDSKGLQRGFQEQLKKAANVATIENNINGFRYMAFNCSRYPFGIKEFRQAVATLIDREYITEKVLQGVAFAQYSAVPPGNAYWFNPDVKMWGKGMTRSQRITEAVKLLKNAGFSWEVEPQVDLEKDKVLKRGKGLIMPDGKKMPSFEFMVMTAGYDPMRYTFGLNIGTWMQEIGIPCEVVPTEFSVVIDKTDERDFDAFLLGWSLSLYPDHMYWFFHSSQAPAGGFNYEMYSNSEFDKLAESFLAEADLVKAREKAFKMQEILAEDLPYIVLFDTPMFEAYRGDRLTLPYTKVLGGIQYGGGMTTTAKLKN